MATDPILATDAKDMHLVLSGLLVPALILRIYLLIFSAGTDHLADCELDSHRLRQAVEVLKFYLTLGKFPLPNWFSHNPLWGPVYLLLFIFLTVSSLSGILLLQDIAFTFGISNHALHSVSYSAISVFVLLHLPAVFSHDLSNKHADISGMINGYKIYQIEDNHQAAGQQPRTVSLDQLLKTRR